MKSRKKYWPFFLFLMAAIAMYISYRAFEMGAFSAVTTQFQGSYQVVAQLAGPEDFHLDRTTGILYISSEDRWAAESGKPVRGGIYSLDLNRTEAKPKLLNPHEPADFHPHGLSLFSGKDGRKILYVVNHRIDGLQTVEVFDINPNGALTLRRTVQDESLVWPNDVVGIGPEKFYVTNVSRYGIGLGQMLDSFFNLKGGYVAYFDGVEMRTVAKKLAFPNGIQISHNGKSLYVAETMSGKLKVFRRNIEDGSLSLSQSHFICSGLDNIDLDEQGSLWIAVHPNLLALTSHLKNSGKKSPSKIIKVVPKQAKFGRSIHFIDSGTLISAASVAVSYKDKLFIGAICESKILRVENKNIIGLIPSN